jgi:hypothetical protein
MTKQMGDFLFILFELVARSAYENPKIEGRGSIYETVKK